MTGILNYGLGNLGSISNMLRVIGEKSTITSDPDMLHSMDRLILPGVGAFDAGMSNLEQLKLNEALCQEALSGKPVLGICLGMQLLGRKSEEGVKPGLALIPFDNKRFRLDRIPTASQAVYKVPHMGWDIVKFCSDSPLLRDISGTQRYYFVHSYHAVCDSTDNILMSCDYIYEFAAAVQKDNIYGVQFHPEKSHDFGMALLSNFVRYC